MTCGPSRPDLKRILGRLKDFQRQTVEYVYRRLYTDPDPVRRFLVADEVGLGKTLVARGVMARAVDHLCGQLDRPVNIVYVCSNADIARQNINKLNITGEKEIRPLPRITLLPTHGRHPSGPVNLVTFTPGTSFELKSNLGIVEERALLYQMLASAWDLRGAGPRKVFQGNASAERFQQELKALPPDQIDPDLAAAFIREVERRPDLRTRLEELADRLRYRRRRPPEEEAQERAQVVGELRHLLAVTCLGALQPDLVILDEFQRFKHLLSHDDEAGELAQQLFNYADETSHARVLLLSATPYKMYTLSHEDDDDHYQDFVATLRFLMPDPAQAEDVEQLLQQYRRELYRLGEEGPEGEAARASLRQLRGEMEQRLRQVMVRTERLAATEDRSGMLKEVRPMTAHLHPDDLRTYVALQRVAEKLDHPDVIHFWKTAPYLLNFMDDYRLKADLEALLDDPAVAEAVAAAAKESPNALFPWEAWERYQAVDPGNARLRALMAETVEAGLWRLLWLPPSLPYYQLGGPFAEVPAQRLTKRLVFSSWRVVPKVIAALLSYEAERRMMLSYNPGAHNTPRARSRLSTLLRFDQSDGRLSGMPVLALMYPSHALARVGDPLALAQEWAARAGGAEATGAAAAPLPSLEALLQEAERRIEGLLRSANISYRFGGQPDEAWYWAAPILLDLHLNPDATREWFEPVELAYIWLGAAEDEDPDSLWAAHVDRARDLLDGKVHLGPPPSDLTRVLALMAVAGPGVVALRALCRATGVNFWGATVSPYMRDSAARIGWAFRSLFNLPEVTALVRGLSRDESHSQPYWRRVLEYCAQGGLQAVMDEYTHLMVEAEGLEEREPVQAAESVALAIADALTLRTATVVADEVRVNPEQDAVDLQERRMRSRFALRYGNNEKGEDDRTVNRAAQVRAAFNSPFWPFVLATTSIGQEGLDFHPYCHAVVHWDLPSNPVDLEQREGRVHRYKGHAVRKNLAMRFGDAALARAEEASVAAAAGEAGAAAGEAAAAAAAPVDTVGEVSMAAPEAAGTGPVDATGEAATLGEESGDTHGESVAAARQRGTDPWVHLFALADAEKPAGTTDLVPYWLYPLAEGAHIERHVPALPLSRDLQRLADLRRSLAVYRMVFGQPRQEDLVEYLLSRLPEWEVVRVLDELRIDLSPEAVLVEPR